MFTERKATGTGDALVVAQALENDGWDVFSITYDGPSANSKTYAPESQFIVWARKM
jgi:NAD(P)H-hydrate repair Nnr-like enzyme with NAD(P)H-hydrate epimerase domain